MKHIYVHECTFFPYMDDTFSPFIAGVRLSMEHNHMHTFSVSIIKCIGQYSRMLALNGVPLGDCSQWSGIPRVCIYAEFLVVH